MWCPYHKRWLVDFCISAPSCLQCSETSDGYCFAAKLMMLSRPDLLVGVKSHGSLKHRLGREETASGINLMTCISCTAYSGATCTVCILYCVQWCVWWHPTGAEWQPATDSNNNFCCIHYSHQCDSGTSQSSFSLCYQQRQQIDMQ